MPPSPSSRRRAARCGTVPLVLAASLVAGALAAGGAPPVSADSGVPAYITDLTARTYDGHDDDLLTAGLGFSGLRHPTPPAIADPERPTAAELRRRTIWAAAGLSGDDGGGLGRLYGPNIGPDGSAIPGEGKVTGTEYTAVAGTSAQSVSFVVQVPAEFDRARPCVIAAPATGLANVYNAVGSVGAWGLHRGCAVAYTDKGMGPGFHDLHSDTVMSADGTTGTTAQIGDAAAFTSGLSDAERQDYDAQSPYRVAFKQAHSRQNPQATWGRDVLRSVELTLALLNRDWGDGAPAAGYTPDTTTVIAAGVSNGGGAAIAAGEDDRDGLIDAVVASEPQMNLDPLRGITVEQGGREVADAGLPLVQYGSLAALLQPCAALAEPSAPGYASFDPETAQRRCSALVGDDPRLIPRDDADRAGPEGLPGLAQEALVRAGFQPESSYLHPSHYDPQTPVSYEMSFARARASDALCGYSWARTDDSGRPAPYTPGELAMAFATSGGRAPSPGTLIDDDSLGGAAEDRRSLGPDGRPDYNLDGQQCAYRLAFPGAAADPAEQAWNERVADGLDETRRDGDLQGKPALIVQGRDDTRVPVNHSSRPYLGLNARAEHGRGGLSYIEVAHAHHSDSTAPGYDNRYVPLGYYYQQALDLMWARLADDRPLPPSQVIRTVPRGGAPGEAPALTEANVPPILPSPGADDRIDVRGASVRVPD
ncbi:3-hydroxybutyrate oligomer hydrolase family protein [Nocardiopsis sediminis]|uniref:3-hydroxybutyrate oligomer hydrolase family protein n=1 Tax=Nocardiopsis sediminis TaxID=1778267 RepID=A0ABV8FMU7_9ACTN